MTSLLWLRRDLRRRDHPALLAAREAAGDGDLVVAFVVDPRLWDGGGPARRAWLAATLRATDEAFDGALTLVHGDPRRAVPELAARVGATSVHVSRETTPTGRRRDEAVAAALRESGVEWVETGTPYAVGPGLVVNGSGDPYKVFTPFSRAWRAHGWPAPAPTPRELPLRHARNDADATAAIGAALAAPDLPRLPDPGEDAALRTVADVLRRCAHGIRRRPQPTRPRRHVPALALPQARCRAPAHAARRPRGGAGHGGATPTRPSSRGGSSTPTSCGTSRARPGRTCDPRCRGCGTPSRRTRSRRGRTGRTGYPVVDAGMRQLLAEGWMHNRVRMITASFLTKDLHVWWPVGARHFLDHLVDGDLASNNHGWQWVAGTGTDASPYFRVFNPVTQGRRFDPDGDYVRRWVPELAHVPGAAVHEPWDVADGHDHGYPERIVDHAEERLEALARLAATKP